MCRVVQKAYIAGRHTTYILVYGVYTSISVYERILGATITTRAQYTTYILVFPYITSISVCKAYMPLICYLLILAAGHEES